MESDESIGSTVSGYVVHGGDDAVNPFFHLNYAVADDSGGTVGTAGSAVGAIVVSDAVDEEDNAVNAVNEDAVNAVNEDPLIAVNEDAVIAVNEDAVNEDAFEDAVNAVNEDAVIAVNGEDPVDDAIVPGNADVNVPDNLFDFLFINLPEPLLLTALPYPNTIQFRLIRLQFSQDLVFTVRNYNVVLEFIPSPCPTIWQDIALPIREYFHSIYGDASPDIFPNLSPIHYDAHFNSPVSVYTCWPGGIAVFGMYNLDLGIFVLRNYTHHAFDDVFMLIDCVLILEFFDIIPGPPGFINVLPPIDVVRVLYFTLDFHLSFKFKFSRDVRIAPRFYDGWRNFVLRFNFERSLIFGPVSFNNIPNHLLPDHYPPEVMISNFWPGAITIFGSLSYHQQPLAPSFHPLHYTHHTFADVRHLINAVLVLDFF